MIKKLIENLIYDKITITQGFTQAKLIAYKLNDEMFKSWINNELNGYPDKVELPEYRIIPAYLKGQMQNGFCTNEVPIALGDLDKMLNGRLYNSFFEMSISKIEQYINSAKDGTIHEMLHPELVLKIEELLKVKNTGYRLVQVAKELQINDVKEIAHITKQILIDILLELNDKFPNMENEFEQNIENSSVIKNIITNNIYGSNNETNFAVGDGNSQIIEKNSHINDKLNELLGYLNEKIDNFGLNSDAKKELKIEVERLEIQKSKSNPKVSIINSSLEAIKGILTGITGNALTPVVLEKINTIMSYFI